MANANAITRTKLIEVVMDAAAAAIADAGRSGEVTAGAALARARAVAGEVVSDGRIAPALTPVPRFDSQTIRGILVAAGAPLLIALCRLAGVELAESAAATALSTVVSVAGAAYAWWGRETTTRPLG